MAQNKPKSISLEKVVGDFQRSWDYTSSNYHQRWEDAWALYNNRRVKKGYEGITNTFVPMTFSTIETMVAGLFGSKPQFDFAPSADKPDQKTDILNALVDHYWEEDKWSIKVIKWGRSMLTYGTGVIYLYWNIDRPVMVNIPLRDYFFDPTATERSNMKYEGRRFLCDIDTLKSYEIVDPETGEMKPRYNNLDKITNSKTTGDETDKEKKDIFYGSTVSEDDEGQVEVIEYWTDDRVVSVANRSVIIEDTENWFKAKDQANGSEYPRGFRPFAAMRDYTDESLFLARGEVDVIRDEQELLNDITNQNIDSVTYTLNQMYTLDPKYAHLLKEIENIPGAVYLAESNALQPIQQRPIPADAFNERINLKNEIRETTASNEVVKGVGNEGAKTTATEVNAQIAGAGQRLGLKITQLENEAFHDLAKIVFEMVKRYVTEPMMIKVVGKEGARWDTFDPAEFDGEYEPRVQLQTTVESQRQDEMAQAKELFAAFLNDPNVDQMQLKRLVLGKAFKLDPDEVDMLLVQQDPMGMPGMPEEMPPEMGLPPEMPMDMPMEIPPQTDVYIDPATGEILPLDTEPTPEELMMIEAGL